MAEKRDSGGEPQGARLLELARAELLQEVLPHLKDDAGYRARLIANALKIAARELEHGDAVEEAEILRQLGEVAAPSLASSGLPPETSLQEALRRGALDGDRQVYELLVGLTDLRRAALG